MKRFIAGMITLLITMIMIVVGTIAVGAALLIWFSITWPWYLWRGIRTLTHPRSFA